MDSFFPYMQVVSFWTDDGAGDGYDYLLGPTFALSLVAALLALVETGVVRRFTYGLEMGAESPPSYTPRLHKMHKFWTAFVLGLVVVVLESVLFANSKMAFENLGE